MLAGTCGVYLLYDRCSFLIFCAFFFFYLVVFSDLVNVLVLFFFTRSVYEKKNTLFSVSGRQLLGVIPL